MKTHNGKGGARESQQSEHGHWKDETNLVVELIIFAPSVFSVDAV
jgi:hypothetical protein